MILDANERERLARQAQELFLAEPADYTTAVPALRQAAALGDVWCLCTLGWCCEFGKGTELDLPQAAWLYRQAADKGYPPAQCNLAVLHITGKGMAPDPAQGAYWLEKAAAQGFARAQYLLGTLYQDGRGVEKDQKRAARLFGDAAFQGYAAAQFSLGVCYERGEGVPQDDVRLDAAIRDGSFQHNPVFLQAIDHAKRNGSALHLLAYLSRKSSHGSIDYPLAICRTAKEQGLADVYLHIIFDGRSTEPGSAPALLAELDQQLAEIGTGRIVDGVGRGIALDRDRNYEKVKLAYDALVDGAGALY